MIQAILAYILIFLTIFLSSVSISFTILKSSIEEPIASKYRVLQQKKHIKSLLKNFNYISTTQDSINRELIYKKIDLQNELFILDSLISEMELNKERLIKNKNVINKNTKILSKALK